MLLLTKADSVLESNTFWAQGGIVGPTESDSVEKLVGDIISAGAGLTNREIVEDLAHYGPKLVKSFLVDKCGVVFNRRDDKRFDLAREAAHSIRRIYHYRDESGKAIIRGLLDRIENMPNICVQTSQMAIDLVTLCHHSCRPQDRYKQNRAMGAYVLDLDTNEVNAVLAPVTVLATGGLGKIFRYTSNPPIATGDGIAMAYRAGIPIINAEFVQFHPTTLFHRDYPNFLISEALRGEGAVLIDRNGNAFMEKYNRKLKDLAPRDEVARAIYNETESSGESHVYLDASRIRNVDLTVRFPSIYQTCMKAGININTEPIPVVPAAHYFCGGVKTDRVGRTSMRGLYAIGETSCTGLHGANRLASVSLLEGLYGGVTLGKVIINEIDSLDKESIKSIPHWISPVQEADSAHINNDLAIIQGLMWNYVGISRTVRRVYRALSDLNYLNHRIDRFYRTARPSRSLVDMRNAALVASIVARAASANTKSQGCHYIRD